MNLLLRIAIVAIISLPVLHEILDFWDAGQGREVAMGERSQVR